MVESTFSWTAKRCWTAGIVPSKLRSLLNGKDVTSVWPSMFDGFTAASSCTIDALKTMTHLESVHCGSFSSISAVTSTHFHGASVQKLRWCPKCASLSGEDHYLPLIFTMPACRVCPIHGCLIESNCRACGAEQRRSWIPAKWRVCRKCCSELSGEPRFSVLDNDSRWVQSQCEALVLHVSDPDTTPVDPSVIRSLALYLESSMSLHQLDSKLTGRIKAKLREDSSSVTFPTLLDLASQQGVSVVDIISRPMSLSSSRIVDGDNLSNVGRFSTDTGAVERLTSVMADGEWFGRVGYVPSACCVLRATKLRRVHLLQVDSSNLEAYDRLASTCKHEKYYELEVAVQKSTKIAFGLISHHDVDCDYASHVAQSTKFMRTASRSDVLLTSLVCIRIALRWLLPGHVENFESLYAEAACRLLGKESADAMSTSVAGWDLS